MLQGEDMNQLDNQSKIRILDKHTANQIAAGEVVERPSSVVKELVENAIDAGAKQIDINIFGYGLEKILVADNGCGMIPDDLVKSVHRHATSKLQKAEDLSKLYTLGFRGEALAAIAAVSKMTVSSKVPGALTGYSINVENGKISLPQEKGMSDGTVVVVEKLFYNTPARKNFLKSPSWEMGQISDIVSRLALSQPQIAFHLKNSSRTIISTNGNGDVNQAIMAIFGKNVLQGMVSVDWARQLLIYGMASLPDLTRANRHQYNFFVNNRWVRSKELAQTVDEAYHTLLPAHRYPVFALFLQMAPDMVDINVHPAKTEIKLREAQIIKENLYAALQEALQKKEKVIPRLGQSISTGGRAAFGNSEAVILEDKSVKENLNRSFSSENKYQTNNNYIAPGGTMRDVPAGSLGKALNSTADSSGMNNFIQTKLPDFQNTEKEKQPANNESGEKQDTFSFLSLRPLGQIGGAFILAAGEGGLYIIDQHAAHERIQYEKIRKKASSAPPHSSLLAVPQTLELTHQEGLWLTDAIIDLHDMGFLLEHFGDNTFILRGVPFWYQGTAPQELIFQVLQLFSAEKGAVKPHSLREEDLFIMACKSAVKANRYLTTADITSIFRQLDACENSSTCPHGRPLIIKLTLDEIRRRFLRGGI